MERVGPKPGWNMALAVVLLAAAPHAWATLARFDAFDPVRLGAWWACYAAFLVAFAATVWRAIPREKPHAIAALLAAQTVAALGANWLIPTVIAGVATGGALLVVVASQLSRLPQRVALPWVFAQHAALLAIYLNAWPTPMALVAGIAFTVFSLTVLSMERMSVRERALRLRLYHTLTQLTEARQRLEERARDAERIRISRELHDLLGHHLVALSLQLQLAERADPVEARKSVERAASLTRLLLGDLRAVVADMREPIRVDLRQSLESLAEDAGPPCVEVQILASTIPTDQRVAAALLRAAQELVTNARKHANAQRITVVLNPEDLTVADDGRGGPIVEGFGLLGLRERIEAIGGSVAIEHPHRGTRARIGFPVERAGPPPEASA